MVTPPQPQCSVPRLRISFSQVCTSYLCSCRPTRPWTQAPSNHFSLLKVLRALRGHAGLLGPAPWTAPAFPGLRVCPFLATLFQQQLCSAPPCFCCCCSYHQNIHAALQLGAPNLPLSHLRGTTQESPLPQIGAEVPLGVHTAPALTCRPSCVSKHTPAEACTHPSSSPC